MRWSAAWLALGCLVFGCDVVVAEDLSAMEARRLESALVRAGAEPTVRRDEIVVPDAQKSAALAIIAAHRHDEPAPEPARLITSPSESKTQEWRRRSSEIARLMEASPEVILAWVVLSPGRATAHVRLASPIDLAPLRHTLAVAAGRPVAQIALTTEVWSAPAMPPAQDYQREIVATALAGAGLFGFAFLARRRST